MTVSDGATGDDGIVLQLQRAALDYFEHSLNPANGLVRDRADDGQAASIAGVGLALSVYPVSVACGVVDRDEALARTLTTLRFLCEGPHGPDPDAMGYRGFFYHFLDMETGRRTRDAELSTIDTACLLAGAEVVAAYFDGEAEPEREVRALVDTLAGRAEWDWAQDGGPTLTHGWRPETGFLPYRWEGFNEALFMYVLALGSPAHAIAPESYDAYVDSFAWREIYGHGHFYAGPLFVHQYSHLWLELRGLQDRVTRERGIDYFENSRRATLVHREYGRRNPLGFKGYGERFWGLTASEGPGPQTTWIDGIERIFHDYVARGAPYGPDDGTVAPWAVVASLPFAPDEALAAIRHILSVYPEVADSYGCKSTVNPTFPTDDPRGWISPTHFALNQGPMAIMVENHHTGLVWRLVRRCPRIVAGLRRAGFRGGWLDEAGDGQA